MQFHHEIKMSKVSNLFLDRNIMSGTWIIKKTNLVVFIE